jgi:hypothetical protein
MPKTRFDNLPMHRKASAQGSSPVSEQPVIYEKREVDPNKEIVTRRYGTERQAQYSQALGLCAEPVGSAWAVNAEYDLSGSWSAGFSVSVGDITEDAGEWTLFFAGANAETGTDNSVRCYLKYDGTDYKMYLDWIDNTSTTYALDTAGALTVTAGADYHVLVTSNGSTATLYVEELDATGAVISSASATRDISGATFSGIDVCQLELLGTHKITTRAKGTAPVLDNFTLWDSVVSSTEMGERDPATSEVYAIRPADLGGYIISPSTGSAKVHAVPSPPQLDASRLYFNGFGGAVVAPYRTLFDRYFQTQTETVAQQKFSVRVSGQRSFRSASTTLLDFGSATEGLIYLELDASGNAKFTYNGTAVTSVATIAEDTDFDIIAGVDGTNVYIILDGAAAVTSAAPAYAPYLDYQRIPDFYIGNDEDPAAGKAFHGYLTKVQFFDYALDTDTSTDPRPAFDLDLSGTYLRDKSKNRSAVAASSHGTTEGFPSLRPGPITDQSFVGVEANMVFGQGALGYTGDYKEPIGTDLSGVRVGDRAFVHSGDSVHVFNAELNQVRPLGLPEPEADVSVQSLGIGALDGAYNYGYRWISQDGTRGPVKRLKPVKATGAASVLIGAGDAEGEEERRELGESYGLAESGAAEHFTMTDSGQGIPVSGSEGYSIESFLAFPDFADLEESVFDRGVTASFTDKNTLCFESDTAVHIDPDRDFSLQLSFQLNNGNITENRAGNDGRHQGLIGLGTQRGGGKTRAFMVYLAIGGVNYSSGTIRMVAARSNGDKDGKYTVLPFNDGTAPEGTDAGLWVSGQKYTLVAVRDGDDLRIHVYDENGDSWTDFVTEGVGFFSGWNAKTRDYPFNATTVKTAAPEQIGDIPGGTTGEYTPTPTTATRIYPMDRDSVFYHARAWSHAVPQVVIHAEANKRYAAVDGGMTHRIKSDVGFFAEDPARTPKNVFDKAAGIQWSAFKRDGGDTGSNPPTAICDQVTGDPTEYNGITITDTGVAGSQATPADDLDNTHYRIYATSRGDGSIVVTTNKASYVLPSKQWDNSAPAAFTKPLADANIDPQQFNWFTNSVVCSDSSGNFSITVKDLAVNGNDIFTSSLGPLGTALDRSNPEDVIVYMGGFPGVTNDGNTHIGEFRWWSKNRYDDPTEQYDFLTGRVKGSEWSDLYFYATFEPADLVTATTYNHRGSLSSDLLTLVNGASIVDTRDTNASGGVTDPAPAIGIPAPPYDYITDVELFRTAAYPINDPEDDGEVQTALQAVRGQPMFRLAQIPAGDSSYVDVAPDDALGAQVASNGGGFIPDAPNGVGIWQNQLLVWRGNEIHFAEPSVFGWESFPPWLTYPVPVPHSGSDIVAVAEVADNLLVCGTSWACLLTGSPSNPRVVDLGSGSGVQAADCLVTQGGTAIGLGENKLWIYQDGQLDETFSLPIHEALPTNGRLAISGALSSLFVIDQSNDQVLRFHFPTRQWSVEERDAEDVGDYGGTAAWVHTSGSYATESSNVYGDDVTTSTITDGVGAVVTTSTISMDVTPNAPVGSRVYVVDASGFGVLTRVVSFT